MNESENDSPRQACPHCGSMDGGNSQTSHVRVERSAFSLGIGQLSVQINFSTSRAVRVWDRVLEHYPPSCWPALEKARFQAMSEQDMWVATRSRCLAVDKNGELQRRHVVESWVAVIAVFLAYAFTTVNWIVPAWRKATDDMIPWLAGFAFFAGIAFLMSVAMLWIPQYVAAEVVRVTSKGKPAA